MHTTDNAATIVQRLEDDIAQCLESLNERLVVNCTDVATHRLLTINGIDCSKECLHDLAVYCVGQIAEAVQANLDIRADLLGIEDAEALTQLLSDVHSMIGQNNDVLSYEQKRDGRDPWLFEALSHLFTNLSTRNPDFLPVGRLIGLMPTHSKVTEQGLDLVAIYAGIEVGLGIGESKKRENDPSGGLREAAEKFTDIDSGNYETDLRKAVGLMRQVMPTEYKDQLTGAFWKNERAYLPFIGYDSRLNPRWTSEREALRLLQVPVSHKLLIPLPIDNLRGFFDDLADAMRDYLESLEG
jgi:hypothetical protein